MRYVFGDYEVDTQRDELRHGGIPCQLESQVFQVLVYLVQHRDRVVSKAELLESLWPQQYISETTLRQRLRLARNAVGDSGRRQRVIKTVPGRGYRFVATVEERADGRSDATSTWGGAPSLQCPRCQHANPAGAKFCNACATPLQLLCPSCGTENPPGAKF